jgi:hypothetical protein
MLAQETTAQHAVESESQLLHPGLSAKTQMEGGELARARAIAQRLGITNLADDDFDVPTYMRRSKERDAGGMS